MHALRFAVKMALLAVYAGRFALEAHPIRRHSLAAERRSRPEFRVYMHRLSIPLKTAVRDGGRTLMRRAARKERTAEGSARERCPCRRFPGDSSRLRAVIPLRGRRLPSPGSCRQDVPMAERENDATEWDGITSRPVVCARIRRRFAANIRRLRPMVRQMSEKSWILQAAPDLNASL